MLFICIYTERERKAASLSKENYSRYPLKALLEHSDAADQLGTHPLTLRVLHVAFASTIRQNSQKSTFLTSC